MSETAQILPDNYYQILLKIRVVGEDERLPEHCPDALQGTFLRKMSELPKSLIEVKILPITCCLHCPDKEKGQNRSSVLNLVQLNIEFISNYFSNRVRQQCRIYLLRDHCRSVSQH